MLLGVIVPTSSPATPIPGPHYVKARTVARQIRAIVSSSKYGCIGSERICSLTPSDTGKERRITRWEHEHVLEAVQRRLDEHPEKMRQRRETVEPPFGTIKYWMGTTHFQMKTLKRVGTEMALHVLAYNLKRVMNIMGIVPLIAAMSAA